MELKRMPYNYVDSKEIFKIIQENSSNSSF
jgi:hypothetical protein